MLTVAVWTGIGGASAALGCGSLLPQPLNMLNMLSMATAARVGTRINRI
jgi:hypothetical protein